MPQPREAAPEVVVSGGGKTGVGGVALAMGEIVPFHPVFQFGVSEVQDSVIAPSRLTQGPRIDS